MLLQKLHSFRRGNTAIRESYSFVKIGVTLSKCLLTCLGIKSQYFFGMDKSAPDAEMNLDL